jgi:flagellar basal body-associated protein FliL
MKRLVILLVIVLLFAGGAGVAWWFLLREAPVDETAEADPEAAFESEDKDKARLRFIEFEPLVLPIIREGQVTLHLTVGLAVELVEPMPAIEIVKMQRPLRDALLSALHAIYALRYIQEQGFEHPLVRQHMMQASEDVLGPGSVKGILLRHIRIQPPVTG